MQKSMRYFLCRSSFVVIAQKGTATYFNFSRDLCITSFLEKNLYGVSAVLTKSPIGSKHGRNFAFYHHCSSIYHGRHRTQLEGLH